MAVEAEATPGVAEFSAKFNGDGMAAQTIASGATEEVVHGAELKVAADRSEETESIAGQERRPVADIRSGGAGPAANGGGIGAPELVEGAAAAVSASDPGGILEQLAAGSPSASVSAFAQARQASTAALGKQTESLQDILPELPAPTGLTGKSEKETRPPAVTGASDASVHLGGEKSGREGEKYDTDVGAAPEPPPLAPTVLPIGDASESSGSDADLAATAQHSLDAVQLETDAISTNAGPRPVVDTTGEADSGQLGNFRASSETEVADAKVVAAGMIQKDFGEFDIFPDASDEALRSSHRLTAQKATSVGGTGALSLTPDVASGLDQSLGPIYSERVTEKSKQYEDSKSQFDADVSNARMDADDQIGRLNDETCQKQLDAQKQAQADVADYREEWQAELDNSERGYREKASKASAEHAEKITAKKDEAEKKAGQILDDAEQKAAERTRQAEQEVEAEKTKKQQESGGFWGWAKSAASALIDGLKRAVNFIYDSLRAAVKGIFALAKKVVLGVIEGARVAIVGLIRGYGKILKGLVSVVLIAFPKIAKKINDKIDGAIKFATDVVNTAADYLKKGVAAALDFLANTIDSLLGLIQSVYNGLLTVIGMLINGEFKELMEKIGGLVDAAKEMPQHLEGAVWEQLLGVDISKPMAGNPETASGATAGGVDSGETVDSGLSDSDITVEPIVTEKFDPELVADLALEDGEERVLGERSGDEYSLAGIAADFASVEAGAARSTTPTPETREGTSRAPAQEPTVSRSENAARVWNQMTTFMGQWLKDNWGKLLLAVIGALIGIIALSIVTGGAILAALPIIMKIVAAVFVGMAIINAMGYLRTYLSEGWAKKIGIAAKAMANAIAVGIVELAMALGFRVVGAALKGVAKGVSGVAKGVSAGARIAVKGVRAGAKAASSGIKRLLKSGATLVSKSGSAIIRRGKLIFTGVSRGFPKGIKKAKDLINRLFGRFRIKRIFAVRKGKIISVYGETNPRFLIMTIEGVEFELDRRGSVKTVKKRLQREFPSAKVQKIRADAPHQVRGNPKLRGKPATASEFGEHTYSKHGPGKLRTEKLKTMASQNKQPQGQFRSAEDIVTAEKLAPMKPGTHIVELPGDVVLPGGKIVPTPYTVVVRLTDGSVKTAYPALAEEIAHRVWTNW